MSIAKAVVEYTVNRIGARALFATHYHELTRIADELPRVKNYCVAVKEWNDEIIFVRTVIPGTADRSYGIHVARLAGLPDAVVARAREILADLEQTNDDFRRRVPEFAAVPAAAEEEGAQGTVPAPRPPRPPRADPSQLSLF